MAWLNGVWEARPKYAGMGKPGGMTPDAACAMKAAACAILADCATRCSSRRQERVLRKDGSGDCIVRTGMALWRRGYRTEG